MGLSKREFIKRMSLFDASGMAISSFCKQYEISESRFYQYRKLQRENMQSSKFEQNHFESISISHQSHSSPTKAMICFPNAIKCELELSSQDYQINLLRELANL